MTSIVLELPRINWEDSLVDHGLSEIEICKIRVAIRAFLSGRKSFPMISEEEFDELIRKVVIIRFVGGNSIPTSAIFSQENGYLILSKEEES